MSERNEKKEPRPLRVPQPKKLGLAVPPLLRLPHEDLIQPQRTPHERALGQPASALSSPQDASERAVEISHAESASLAKPDALASQIASLANPASLANSAGLKGQSSTIRLMNSLPETSGFTKLHHQIVDHLYGQLSAKEQVVHIQLYRLSWGKGRSNCFITLPKLARRCNLSQRSVGEAVALLERKGLIRKESVVTGRGKEQGIEYSISPAPALAKSASLANPASLAKSASLANFERSKEYKEEIHEEHTHKELRVGGESRFTHEQCLRFAEHLRRTGEGITNPGGYATVIHRSGEADPRIDAFLNPPLQYDVTKCPDCKGTGFNQVERDGREGVVRCGHEQLQQQKPDV